VKRAGTEPVGVPVAARYPHADRLGGYQPRAKIARGGNLLHSSPPGAWVWAHRSRQAALLLQHGLPAAPAEEVETAEEEAEDVQEAEDEEVELVAEYVYEEAEAAVDAQAAEEADVVAEQLHASAGRGFERVCRLPTRDVVGSSQNQNGYRHSYIHTYIHTY
jgi:NACalpha-BTF3-like transcription factor